MSLALKTLTWHLPQPDSAASENAFLIAPSVDKRAALAILDLPSRERPDVIGLNGVTDLATLIEVLGPSYPFNTANLGVGVGSAPDERSGLVLFSKLPFLTLPTGGTCFYEPFVKTGISDIRGVGVVRVAGPHNPTTIAFTHLFTKAQTGVTLLVVVADEAAVREVEFALIRAVLLKVANGSLQNYANSVVMGDFNMFGETGQTLNEAGKIFAGVPGTFGGDFRDGWGEGMHAPNDLTGHDPGDTRHAQSSAARLDYQCTRRDANEDIGLVAHHMSIPLRLRPGSDAIIGTAPRPQYLDRSGLIARLHRINPHCSPSTAVELLKEAPVNSASTGSLVWMMPTDFGDEDMYHWVYIGNGGTYSVFVNKSLEVAAFRRSDLTHALAPTDVLEMSDLPPAVHGALGALPRRIPLFEEQGSVFACREPFFLRFRGVLPTFAGESLFAIVQHHGESAETAFVLQPHMPVNPGLPAGQKLGTTDACFFRADRPSRFSGAPYIDRFLLSNPAQAGVMVEVLDQVAGPPVTTQHESESELEVPRVGGEETIFLVVTRDDVNDVDFSVTWDSPLSYLNLETVSFELNEETGVSGFGADELELTVAVDGEDVYHNRWDDADSDENWPYLALDIRSAVEAKLGKDTQWIALSDEILFSVIKTDGAFAHGSSVGVLSSLKPDDSDVKVVSADIKISDPAGDGWVIVEAELRKFAP